MSATTAKTQFAQINDDKRLAYRVSGDGYPVILVNRFRGNLDTWDPAFLDAIAQGNQVIIFEHSGKSSSTGAEATTHMEMAQDVIDLADALGIDKFAVGGWSLGGFVAQVTLTEFPERVSHGILIGTRAPGTDLSPISPVFYQHAPKPTYSLEDEVVLFFNPKYESSVEAARVSRERLSIRKDDLSTPMTQSQWQNLTQVTGFPEDTYDTLQKMKETTVPVLVLIGEDDICFPAKDWTDLNGSLPSAQMILFGASGHGPQHQFPELAASYIREFIART